MAPPGLWNTPPPQLSSLVAPVPLVGVTSSHVGVNGIPSERVISRASMTAAPCLSLFQKGVEFLCKT